jgi:prepilin-type N-terminal cleavage/methylation domain-containing protein
MLDQELLTRRSRDDAGFTLIELVVVLLVSTIVLVIAGSTLISLNNTTSRVDSMTTDEQEASTVLAQVSRDIRSAHTVTFSGFSTPNPIQELELQMNQPANTWVEWVYTPTAATVNGAHQGSNTLVRYVGSSATGTFKQSAPSVSTPVNVGNGTTIPLFQYFQVTGAQMYGTAANVGTLDACTTRVTVTLEVIPQSKESGIPSFELTDDVTITDQAALWSSTPCLT